MIFATNAAGSLTYLSEGWETLTGQPVAQAVSYGWVAAVHPDDRLVARDTVAEAIAAHTEFSLRYRLLRPDGRPVWVVGGGVPARRLDDNAFLGFVGSVSPVGGAARSDLGSSGRIGRFRPPLDGTPRYRPGFEQAADHLLKFNALFTRGAGLLKPVSLEVALAEIGQGLAASQRFLFGTQPN